MSEKRRLSEKRGLTPFFRQFEKRVSVPAFRNVGKSTLYNRIAGRQGAKRKTGTDSIFGSLKIVSVPAFRRQFENRVCPCFSRLE